MRWTDGGCALRISFGFLRHGQEGLNSGRKREKERQLRPLLFII